MALTVLGQNDYTLTSIQAPNPTGFDHYGYSISIDSNFAVIASPGDAADRGAVYVYEIVEGEWIEKQKLIGSDIEAADYFGGFALQVPPLNTSRTVYINGDLIIIGCEKKDDLTGAAYIFERSNSNTWIEVQKLVGSNVEDFDQFGASVAITDSFAFVGAAFKALPGGLGGSVYVFRRDQQNNAWEEWQIIDDFEDVSSGEFGSCIEVDEQTLLISDGERRVYVYEINNENKKWELSQTIIASDFGFNVDDFGQSIDLHDTLLIIGKPYQIQFGVFESGSAYIYEKKEGSSFWEEKQIIQSLNPEEEDYFGMSVAINDSFAIVGAPFKYEDAGAAYLFKLDTLGWIQVEEFVSPRESDDHYFGFAVDINSYNFMIGAPEYDFSRGEVYISGDLITSQERNSLLNTSLVIYPSPAKQLVFLKGIDVLKQPIAYTITNSFGQQVLNGRLREVFIDITSLSKGIHFLILKTRTGKTISRKLIKQ